MLSTFSCAFWLFVCLLRKVYSCSLLILKAGYVFFVLFCFAISCLFYVLNISQDQVYRLEIFSSISQIFSLLCSLFLLLYRSFCLMHYHLSIFTFIVCACGVIFKKIIALTNAKKLFPMFSSSSFTVSGLTFESLIRFELIFVNSVRQRSNFINLHENIPVFPANFLKRQPFHIECSWLSCIILADYIYYICLNFVPLVYVPVFMTISCCFYYCSFVIKFEIGNCDASTFVLIFQDYFGYLGPFVVTYEFQGCFSTSVKNVIALLLGIVLN